MNNFYNKEIPQKSWKACLIWGIILGGLGAHNFYIGNSAKGFVELIVGIVIAFLDFAAFGEFLLLTSIYEMFMVYEAATKNFDAYGRPLLRN